VVTGGGREEPEAVTLFRLPEERSTGSELLEKNSKGIPVAIIRRKLLTN
jgi:hypothetical protein